LGRAPPRLAAAVSAGAAVAVFAALYAADLDSASGVPVLGIAAWVISATARTVQRWGSLGVLALMALESSSLPVPSEVVLPLSGYLIRAGSMDPVTAFLAALAGSMAGSYVDYYIGRAFGVEVLGRLPWVSGDALRRAEEWFRGYGEPMVIVTRMIPGVRTLISFPAGALGMGAAKFGVYTAIGSALWDAVLMGAGYGLAAGWEAASAAAQDLLMPAIAAAAVGIVLYVALTAAWPAAKDQPLPALRRRGAREPRFAMGRLNSGPAAQARGWWSSAWSLGTRPRGSGHRGYRWRRSWTRASRCRSTS
jgi:membrane protein DedA with SNARE-associated domain